jgi:hypothetical protein
VATRRELIEAVAARYRAGGREEKKEILDEFVKVTGFHRKHAIRVLKKRPELGTLQRRDQRTGQALCDLPGSPSAGCCPGTA